MQIFDLPQPTEARGGIAQLGERLHGMQEVIGSIPFTSTKHFEYFLGFWLGCREAIRERDLSGC